MIWVGPGSSRGPPQKNGGRRGREQRRYEHRRRGESQRETGRCSASGFEDGGRDQEPRPAVPLESGKAGNRFSLGAPRGNQPCDTLILAQEDVFLTSAVQTATQVVVVYSSS